ncbi:urease accessory protein UreJ [Candidatus Woesearchaeota archaeon]|nr:MAG: urease accessory protein UreJ [Candidatus Woesearchaeota archaeon]
MKFKILLYVLLLFTVPVFVHAHLIGGLGFGSGITHPLFGIDHLLAMIAVGIISVQYGGKAVWMVPATFVLIMLLGGLLAIAGLPLLFVETGIALSVLFLGLTIAFAKKIPLVISMVGVGLFAFFHGHAHGTEMPLIANPLFYALGFVLATAALHVSGILIGLYAKKSSLKLKLLQYSGIGMGIMGICFLFSII